MTDKYNPAYKEPDTRPIDAWSQRRVLSTPPQASSTRLFCLWVPS